MDQLINSMTSVVLSDKLLYTEMKNVLSFDDNAFQSCFWGNFMLVSLHVISSFGMKLKSLVLLPSVVIHYVTAAD